MTFLSDRKDTENDKVKTKPQNRICWRDTRKKNVGGRTGMRRDKNKTRRDIQKWVNNRKKIKNDKPLVNIFSN
jgi:hypothetical protein